MSVFDGGWFGGDVFTDDWFTVANATQSAILFTDLAEAGIPVSNSISFSQFSVGDTVELDLDLEFTLGIVRQLSHQLTITRVFNAS